MPDGGSVPIVSQTEIEPMKTALSFMLSFVTTTALQAPPRREAAGLVPARLSRIGLVLHAVAGRARGDRQAEQRPVSMGWLASGKRSGGR